MIDSRCRIVLQLFEAERNIDMNQQEILKLRQRIREDEDQWRLREQELLTRLEENRIKERKLEDQKHNLELSLTDTNQQVQDLKVSIANFDSSRVCIVYFNAFFILFIVEIRWQ